MKKAFTYMFDDNKFLQKAGIYSIFAIMLVISNQLAYLSKEHIINVPILSMLFITVIGICASLITTGYRIANIKLLGETDENIVLPYINFKKNIVAGFKYSVACALLVIPVLLVICCTFFLLGLSTLIPAVSTTSVIINLLYFTCIAMLIAFILFFAYFSYGYMIIFSVSPKWTVFYKFKELFNIALRKKYALNMLVIFAVTILAKVIIYIFSLLTNFCPLTLRIILQSILETIIVVYIFYVVNYFVGELYKRFE